MSRECVICAEPDSEEEPLLELPCFHHWACRDGCIADYFEKATSNESLYPPQCCDEPILLHRFSEHVPKDVQTAFLAKEQGEYTVLPKYRVYCAGSACGRFLHPNSHIKDVGSSTTYAVCESEDCFQATCCYCKLLLVGGIEGHVCKVDDIDRKFKETVDQEGYKECYICGATVELAEACNHITCECGNSFCYVCGKEWGGIHGCPQYGPARYDDEGYNQDGYHRDTGLNREGITRREEMNRQREELDEDEPDDEGDDREHEQVEDMWRQIMSHVDPDRRAMLESLDPEEREDVLMQLQIEFIDQGIAFNILRPAEAPQPDDDGDGEIESDIGDVDEGDEEDNDESNEERDDQAPEVEAPLDAEVEGLLNVEVIQGVDPTEVDRESVLGVDQVVDQAWPDDDNDPGLGAIAANEVPLMAGSWVDSDADSVPETLSSSDISNGSSPDYSTQVSAPRSDQEQI